MAIIKNPDGTITVGRIAKAEEPKPVKAEAPATALAEEKPKKATKTTTKKTTKKKVN